MKFRRKRSAQLNFWRRKHRTEIGESLIEEEADKMARELEHAVERQGGVFTDYLNAPERRRKRL